MKNILVPTDFSECAKNAAEVAAGLCRETGAKLYLMHIINMPTYESSTSIETFHDVAEGLFIMKHVKNKFLQLRAMDMFKDLEFEEVVEFNSVYECIAEQAEKREIDLIIMGTHGIDGTKELLIGSNAERVIRSSKVPVLTIKKRHEKLAIKDIVFASNFYEESYTVFNQIVEVAKVLNARIHLLKVITPSHFEAQRYSIKLMEDFVTATDLQLDHTINIYNETKIENGIHNFADDIDADMIAMETHGRTGIQHMLWGSITESVANHSSVPILSVKLPVVVETPGIFPD
jgi:nucleotide-binding universal stress UspA family protein